VFAFTEAVAQLRRAWGGPPGRSDYWICSNSFEPMCFWNFWWDFLGTVITVSWAFLTSNHRRHDSHFWNVIKSVFELGPVMPIANYLI
jgi:hypothetical protein